MIKVGINGYGTIGKRVAEAVTLQDDMEIVGIVKTKPTYEMRGALDANYPVFASTKSKVPFFEKYGIKVSWRVPIISLSEFSRMINSWFLS